VEEGERGTGRVAQSTGVGLEGRAVGCGAAICLRAGRDFVECWAVCLFLPTGGTEIEGAVMRSADLGVCGISLSDFLHHI
jgi:hypothetical protein